MYKDEGANVLWFILPLFWYSLVDSKFDSILTSE